MRGLTLPLLGIIGGIVLVVGGDRAKDLGPLLGTSGTVDIGDAVDSSRYHSVVLVPQDLTKPARRGPAPIGFQAQL